MFFPTRKEAESSISLQCPQPCRQFTFDEIQLATENFDESLVIGHGGFGKVYKGTIVNGASLVVAAIKRLDSLSSQGAEEFWAEVEMLSKLRHCHLVSLIGYCNQGREMVLVYEYMPHGTLEDHLHKFVTPLSWIQRLKICIGAARGLDYLHTGTGIQHGIIHRDVKSSNILLHESWAAKISDFGLSKIGPTNQPSTYVNTLVKGTFGYLDPDYFSTGRLTRKSDVYAFGVVLLEVLCGKRAVDRSLDEEEWGLVGWAQDYIKEGNLKQIIDPNLKGQISAKCLNEFAKTADRCLHSRPKQRPTMAEIVFVLESVLALQEKANNSLQRGGIKIFGIKLPMFNFPSNGESSARDDAKLSSNSKGNGRNTDLSGVPDNRVFVNNGDVPADTEFLSSCLKTFTFADLRMATGNFGPDRILGKGGFGKVFLGWVDQRTWAPSSHEVGIAVAVKRFNSEGFQGTKEWLAEVNFLGRLSHSNIISLLGYCCEDNERLLVYEFMKKGSFSCFIFRNAKVTAEPLSWGTRLKIMIGVARGLSFLHSSKDQVIHRGVKSSDILLDQDFNAKLGYFGVARSGSENGDTHVSTAVRGTYGYAAPEYLATGHLTAKSDVYSFGVVLLETLTGLQVIDHTRPKKQQNLVEWAMPFLEAEKKLMKIMDPHLGQNYPRQGSFQYGKLVHKCLQHDRKKRPSSEEVLRTLEQINAIRV